MRNYLFFQTREVANEQLVRQIDRKRHRELFWVALTGIVLAAAVMAYAWPQFQLIQLGYRMEEMRVRKGQLIEMRRHLELQLATESSPSRIERIAETELGLSYPDPTNVVVLESVEAEPASAGALSRGAREVERSAAGLATLSSETQRASGTNGAQGAQPPRRER